MIRKILYHPCYGSGWSSWSDGPTAKYMLEYSPIIEAIERGEKMHDEHPLVLQLEKECIEKFGVVGISKYGANGLKVREVYGLVRIKDRDGFEQIEELPNSDQWI